MPTTEEIQVNVDRLAYTDQAGTIPTLAAQINSTTLNRAYYVDTLSNLPNPQTTFVTEGLIFYVEEIKNYVIYTGVSWAGIDGRVLNKSGARLYGWGLDTCGQLGTNCFTNQLICRTEITCDYKWCAISAGGSFSTALKSDNTLWSWGSNNCGQLGINNIATRGSPVREITSSNNWCSVSAGLNHTMALKKDNSLWLWGDNSSSQLGDNTTVSKSSPVREVTIGNSWCAISAGTCTSFALKVDGSLWAWGQNSCGQLGDNTTAGKVSPVREISASSNWCKVASHTCSTYGIKTDGSLWAWGQNNCGQLGDNTATVRSSPVREVTQSTNWLDVTTAGLTTSAIKKDGSLWSWGDNICGQLADGTITNRSSPVRESCLSTDWCKVSMGGVPATPSSIYNMAIKRDGSLWGWGVASCGQTSGPNLSAFTSFTPRAVGSVCRWADVSASTGGTHTLGLNGYPVC